MEEAFNDLQSISQQKDTNIFNYLMKKLSGSNSSDIEIKDLIQNLKNAQNEFETAINNYEFAEDPELVDYYTYKIKATQTRYQYLLKKAKEHGL